jgi:hypothetical protein
MNRHLLPHEFDLLLDEEVGFGIPPLWAHVRECSECAAEFETARMAAAQIERLPRLTPSPLFAERVMSQVQVFRPWHVGALEAARRIVPRPGPLRTVLATAMAIAAVTLTGGTMWAATRVDSFLLLLGLIAEQARLASLGVIGTVFGAEALATFEAGGTPLVLLSMTVLLFSALGGAAWLTRAARAVRARSR